MLFKDYSAKIWNKGIPSEAVDIAVVSSYQEGTFLE